MAVTAFSFLVAAQIGNRAVGDYLHFRCDTEAELPATQVQNGDKATTLDTKKRWTRSAGSWVEETTDPVAAWGKIVGTLSNQSDIQAAIDNASGGGPHTHDQDEVTDLETDLAAIDTALSGKADSVHSHAQSDVTNLVTALAGKAASSHSHAQSDVTSLVSDLAGKAATAHNHAAADINSGTVATARLGAGTANSTTYLRGDQTWATPAGGSVYKSVTIHADAGALVTLTNQANAEQFLGNSNRNIQKVDLTGFTQVRLLARVVTASASVNTPRVYLEYHTSFTTTVGTFSDIGSSAVNCSLAAAGLIDSGWINLVAGAKADVFIAVLMNGGDAAADPALGWIVAEFK